jgi:hypothetical protein
LSDTDVISSLNRAAKNPSLPGHEDASAVIYRKQRFRAIALPEAMTEQNLKEFKAREKIADSDIDWEFYKIQPPPDRLSFPVARRHVIIRKARECSELLLKVPSKKSNWVFIAPQRDLVLIDFLENWVPS